MTKRKKQTFEKKLSHQLDKLEHIPTPDGQHMHYFLVALAVISLGTLWFAARHVAIEVAAFPDQEVIAVSDPSETVLKKQISGMVHGYPIEGMAKYIAKEDKTVAAYLVSIAKKESDWGKRVPVSDDGRDCYNYWGYRGQSDEMGTGGHTCFATPAEAVRTVAERIHALVYEYGRDKPAEMIVWKCGYTCDGHSPESVEKWKRDVAYYYGKFSL